MLKKGLNDRILSRKKLLSLESVGEVHAARDFGPVKCQKKGQDIIAAFEYRLIFRFYLFDQNAFNQIIKTKLNTLTVNRIENRNHSVFYRERRRVRRPPNRYRDEEGRCNAARLPRQRPPGIVPGNWTGNRHAAAGSNYSNEVPAGPGLG